MPDERTRDLGPYDRRKFRPPDTGRDPASYRGLVCAVPYEHQSAGANAVVLRVAAYFAGVCIVDTYEQRAPNADGVIERGRRAQRWGNLTRWNRLDTITPLPPPL